MVLAHEEANGFKHDYIGTEHLLLGLVRDSEGFASRVLHSFEVTVERVRGEVVRIVGVGQAAIPGQIPFTQRAKTALEQALQEAIGLGHNYIGTEHILLGVVWLNEGPATQILRDLGVGEDQIRAEVIRMLSGGTPRPPASAQPLAPAPAQPSPPAGFAQNPSGEAQNRSGDAPSRAGFDEWIRVGPGDGARRLLHVAAGRALDDGRSEIEARDVLLALTRDEKIAPVLADLGVDEAAVLEALARRRPPQPPPHTSAGG